MSIQIQSKAACGSQFWLQKVSNVSLVIWPSEP